MRLLLFSFREISRNYVYSSLRKAILLHGISHMEDAQTGRGQARDARGAMNHEYGVASCLTPRNCIMWIRKAGSSGHDGSV
jgi:hypothetical protein